MLYDGMALGGGGDSRPVIKTEAGRYPRVLDRRRMPRLRHDSTVLASSRTLRAGFADAAGGILDEACARRSGDRQVGTKGWPLWSNNGMDRTGSRRGLLGAGSVWIEQRMRSQHRTGDGKHSVGDGSQCAPMRMAAFAQLGVASAAQPVVLNGGPRPVIDSSPQTHVTGLAHNHDAALAAPLGHRRDTAQTAERVIISLTQGLPGLGEQRGEDDPSDSRQGPQDRHVALLLALPRLRFLGSGEVDAEGIEPPMRLLELTVHDLQPKRDHTDMSGCRLGRAAGDRDRRLVQDPLRLFGVDATDPMRLQELGDGLLAQLDRFRGCRNQCPKLEEPVGRDIVRELDRLRGITPELFADAVT